MRQTSIDTYNQIKNEGLLSKMRFRAYDIVFNYGPMTASELEKKEKDLFPIRIPNSFMHQRLSELRDRGVIRETTIRTCSITGRMAIEWDIANGLPINLEKKKSKDEIIRELNQEIIELKKIINNSKNIQDVSASFSSNQRLLFDL